MYQFSEYREIEFRICPILQNYRPVDVLLYVHWLEGHLDFELRFSSLLLVRFSRLACEISP